MGFGVTGIYIIITKPTYSTGSHNVIIVLVKFFVEIRVCNRYVGQKYTPLGLLLDICWWWWWWWCCIFIK